jgi:hypothetical protein
MEGRPLEPFAAGAWDTLGNFVDNLSSKPKKVKDIFKSYSSKIIIVKSASSISHSPEYNS